MPKFDLSDVADFSRVTQGALGNLNSLFGGRDPKEWDIVEAAYNGVKFHVFNLSSGNLFDDITGRATQKDTKTVWEGAVNRFSDFSGRRKVKYSFPYRDGQTTDDQGRKAQSFEVEALIFGPRYMEGYNRLMAEFDKPTPGKLIHPVRGELDCVVEDVQHIHAGDSRKAVALKITFSEHNFSVGTLGSSNNSVKSKLTDALQIFKTIDGIIKKIEGAQLLARGIKNLLNSYMAIYKRDSARTLTKMNTTFNTKGGSTDIPALLPVNIGGSGVATSETGGVATGRVIAAGTFDPNTGLIVGGSAANGGQSAASALSSANIVRDTNFVVVRSVSDPFNGVPTADLLGESTAVAVAITQLTKEVQTLRDLATVIIQIVQANGAALELNDVVLEMRQTVVTTQSVLEAGAASSNARIISYTVPRLMSIREVAFANGITPDRVEEVDLLNPDLLSVNFIEKGTVMRIPSA